MGSNVADIIIKKIITDVETTGTLPWQNPYQKFNAFNWYNMTPYKGINKMLLPFGEYLSFNQIKRYNKEHGTDYKVEKGKKWYEVVFFKRYEKEISNSEFEKVFPNISAITFIQSKGYNYHSKYYYFVKNGKIYCQNTVLRYTRVADRSIFKNANGESLPSKVDLGEAEIVNSDAKRVIKNYIDRENVKMSKDFTGLPRYDAQSDTIFIKNNMKNQDLFASALFHEIAHSTGISSRLGRDYYKSMNSDYGEFEECVAEITASLLCAECGLHTFSTSESESYKNNIAYVQKWKSRISDWNSKFIYLVSEADRAFNFILQGIDDSCEEDSDE